MRVISGGQTGADQGGLEAAQEAGFETGGWIPKGWLTDDGPNLQMSLFGLKEMPRKDYGLRTDRNVSEADVVFWYGRTNSRGFHRTRRAALKFQKPFHCFTAGRDEVDKMVAILDSFKPGTLMIAGNRESKHPGLRKWTRSVVTMVLKRCEMKSLPDLSKALSR
jgi:hypothetical protein